LYVIGYPHKGLFLFLSIYLPVNQYITSIDSESDEIGLIEIMTGLILTQEAFGLMMRLETGLSITVDYTLLTGRKWDIDTD